MIGPEHLGRSFIFICLSFWLLSRLQLCRLSSSVWGCT